MTKKRLVHQNRCLDDTLLAKKDNRDVLESLPERIRNVRLCLEIFKPSLVCDIVPIHDVYGPTATDANIQALVVSKETASGGKAGMWDVGCFSWWRAHIHWCSSGQIPRREGLATTKNVRDRRDIT
jgi:hypothetical protein